jgi:hypothetical protein
MSKHEFLPDPPEGYFWRIRAAQVSPDKVRVILVNEKTGLEQEGWLVADVNERSIRSAASLVLKDRAAYEQNMRARQRFIGDFKVTDWPPHECARELPRVEDYDEGTMIECETPRLQYGEMRPCGRRWYVGRGGVLGRGKLVWKEEDHGW